MKFAPLSSDNFSDFCEIMNSMQISKDCFCYSHRVEPENIELGFPAQRQMQRLTDAGFVNGMIAYVDEKPVLWVGAESAGHLVGHDLYSQYLDEERPSTWVIHCLTSVPLLKNRKEVCVATVKSLLKHLNTLGAKKILSFPVKTSKHAGLSYNLRFMGNEPIFEAAGFRLFSDANQLCNMWVYEFEAGRPKLSIVN